MGTLKQIKQTVTYKVPNWNYCNLINPITGGVQVTKCRFCTYDRKHGYNCAMYNMPLGMSDVNTVNKASQCIKATAGSLVSVTDTTSVQTSPQGVDPKKLIKLALDAYNKEKQRLIGQGYPAALADSLARDYLLGGQ